MSDVFTLGGSAITVAGSDFLPIKYRERFGAIPTFTMQLRGAQPPPESSDPWMGKTFTWANGGTTYFSGRIRSRNPRRDGVVGWVTDYQAFGLRDYLDRFPHTDSTTGLDTSAFNAQREDLANYNAARAGRTVGQILTAVLTMAGPAAAMQSYGVGNISGSGPYTLPANTVSDLSALTVIPPRTVYFTGERFGDAIDSFLTAEAPNIRCWVEPSDGALRFLDIRTFAAQTLTMGSDPIEPTEISRDVSDCWQRVEVRGAPIAVMFLFKTSQGSLVEDFAYGALTNAQAKAAWTPADFVGTTHIQDAGTCTMGSTTTVTVTTSQTYTSNQWDQTSTGLHGTINLYYSAGTGITTMWTSPIVSNTATSGGTSTVTISVAAPNTNYDHFTITGIVAGAGLVWRQYKLNDSTLWPLMVNQSTYEQPFINPGGGATLTSAPMGAVLWPETGSSPPYNMFPLPFQMFPSNGTIVFAAPTYITANNQAPADVWALIPINTGPNVVYSPQNSGGSPVYGGDSHTIEGLTDTRVITMAEWRDPGQVAQVQAYADDQVAAVENGRREGSITYYGLYTNALTFGMSLDIAGLKDDGTADTTGWESAAIPVIGVEVEWSQGAVDYITRIDCSNRREARAADQFMRPPRTFLPIGFSEGHDVQVFGADLGLGNAIGASLGATGGLNQQPTAIPTSLQDLGIASNPAEFLMNAGADPFGGLNPEWNSGQAELFGNSEQFAPPEQEGGPEK